MQPLGLNEIREKYLSFFESKDHLRLPSFSLVPQDDPSILLINAGMTPLKPYFTGAQTPPSLRIATCQKCIRTPDIERVGFTARHGTYFEMLGNFSFGDYFKNEIIPWAWEFCTTVLEMPADRLYPSVYEEDDEAFAIWRDVVGVPEEKITRLGKEDNFWEHGTGPCGPCSEIYFDRGIEYGCGKDDCKVGCDCDRFVEFWNLVFTQFNRAEDGSYSPLDKKNIDTGAGLERIACIMQGVDNLFEVDTIRSILEGVCKKVGAEYGKDHKTDTAIRVITDHVRSTTMMISDGVLPSNEGRGYVLRRLLRRAIRFGRLLGVKGEFLQEIASIVIEQNKDAYPALVEKQVYIMKVLQKEEESFLRTLEQGTEILSDYIEEAKKNGENQVSGENVFRLHDTYGFPFDLTKEIALDAGLRVDEDGFLSEMKKQKDAARTAAHAKNDTAWGGKRLPDELLKDKSSTIFIGYDVLEAKSTLLYLMKEDEEGALQLVNEAFAGDDVIAVFDKSPFYASSGGQVHDEGVISGEKDFSAEVYSVDKDAAGKFLHGIRIRSGHVMTKDTVTLSVSRVRRLSTARNHTATHLLQKALRSVLGEHVEQAGSLVTPERLRFDFTHFQPITVEELSRIEEEVNRVILLDLLVTTKEMSQEEARKLGAMALFGEKYGDLVRVVSVSDTKEAYSVELCGGTHLTNTSQAAQLRILSETGVASGVRRIEAITGEAAYHYAKEEHEKIEELSQSMKVPTDQLLKKMQGLQSEIKALEKELLTWSQKATLEAAQSMTSKQEIIKDFAVLVDKVQVESAESLRDMGDQIRDRMEDGVLLLGAEYEGKLLFVAMATPKAVKAGVHAGNIVKAAAQTAGGGGGGRPDMAQAGGRDVTKLQASLEAGKAVIVEQLN